MSDSSEGIVSLPVPGPPGSGTPCEEAHGRRAPGADARSLLPDLAAPPPAALWAEDGAAAAAACPSTAARAKGGGRRTAVTYVINEASQGPLLAAESGALQSLREACEAVGAALETLHFGKLDFGETAVLDRFYNAGLRHAFHCFKEILEEY
ncbi:mitogen-activated protein kinase kinase kinase 5 [Pitangus sulphuratus]|nr:mitogen-activated protein kinase kinase kinase 5 [Pitangus sulphuratus]